MSKRDMRLYYMDILDSGSAILPPEVDSGLRRNDDDTCWMLLEKYYRQRMISNKFFNITITQSLALSVEFSKGSLNI
jgi:hypothetical protein